MNPAEILKHLVSKEAYDQTMNYEQAFKEWRKSHGKYSETVVKPLSKKLQEIQEKLISESKEYKAVNSELESALQNSPKLENRSECIEHHRHLSFIEECVDQFDIKDGADILNPESYSDAAKQLNEFAGTLPNVKGAVINSRDYFPYEDIDCDAYDVGALAKHYLESKGKDESKTHVDNVVEAIDYVHAAIQTRAASQQLISGVECPSIAVQGNRGLILGTDDDMSVSIALPKAEGLHSEIYEAVFYNAVTSMKSL